MVESLGLAAVSSSARGMPPPSTARWSLLPCLPRSVGFGPVCSLFRGAEADRVHADPAPVQPAGLTELVEQGQVELVEQPGPGPAGEPAVGSGPAPAAQLTC